VPSRSSREDKNEAAMDRASNSCTPPYLPNTDSLAIIPPQPFPWARRKGPARGGVGRSSAPRVDN
jgi:hypothetical protein